MRLVPGPLKLVEPADQAQHACRRLWPFGRRLKKIPPGVRPAAHPGYALMRAHEGRIGFVAVGLEDGRGISLHHHLKSPKQPLGSRYGRLWLRDKTN